MAGKTIERWAIQFDTHIKEMKRLNGMHFVLLANGKLFCSKDGMTYLPCKIVLIGDDT